MLKVALDWLLTLLKHPTFWVVIIITLVAVGYARQSSEIKDLQATVVEQSQDLITTHDDLLYAVGVNTANQEAMAANQAALIKLEESNKQLEEKLNETKSKLDSYRSRERVAASKPALVESRANAATKRVFNELSCSTGNTNLCDDQAGTPYTFDRTGD